MENANILHFQCTILILLRIAMYTECIYVFYENLVLIAECHVDC